ncbi:Uncharacterised protein [Mycobacteroides abscessus subsp. abscessus]|nr:Uncharacterised protein [Mycobacteroides abscessus subsp. abscessus]
METDNFFSDQMDIRRPIVQIFGVVFCSVAKGRNIVGKRIDPYIYHMLWIVRHFYAPVKGCP